jgi:hypothetical protein
MELTFSALLAFGVFQALEVRPRSSELDKGVLNEVFGLLMIAPGQPERPAIKKFIAPQEDFFVAVGAVSERLFQKFQHVLAYILLLRGANLPPAVTFLMI